MKKPKVIKDFQGIDYVQERRHYGNLTVVRNFEVTY